MKFVAILFSIYLLSEICGAVQLDPTAELYDEVYIRHIAGRPKRSESSDTGVHRFEFPERTSFSLVLRGKKVRLDLKLNKIQERHTRLRIVTAKGISAVSDEAVRDYAYYQILSEKTKAAVRVRCSNFGYPCHIEGSFHFEGQLYSIEPNHNKPKLHTKLPHTIYRTHDEHDGDYTHDTINKIIQTKRKSNGSSDGARMKSNRHKRQTTVMNYQVELEMVIDYSIFEFWSNYLGTTMASTLSTIREFYEQVANNMDLRYESLTLDSLTVDIVPLEITIITVNNASTWIIDNRMNTTVGEVVDASTALDDFKDWAVANRNNLSAFDGIMAFTREDIGFFSGGQLVNNGQFTLGIAFTYSRTTTSGSVILSALCGTGVAGDVISVSLVEDRSLGDVSRTAAHELAHTMGVPHDGSSDCAPSDQFIMAPSQGQVTGAKATNPWTFSDCSQAVIEETMDRLLEENNDMTCLQSNSYDEDDYRAILGGPTLGELYTLDEQCEIYVSPGSERCAFQSDVEEEFCFRGIFCLIPGTNSCAPREVMAGSSCGGTKRCYRGQCVDNLPSRVPTTTSTTTTTTPTTTTTTPTTTTTTPTTTTTTPTTTTTTPTTTTTTPTTTTTTPTTTTTTPTTTTTTPTTTTTTPTTTTTTPTTTTTTPTTTTTTPTTTTTTPTTTTTTSTTTTTTPTTTTTTPTTTTTTPTTTTTTPTTTTTTPTTTTTTPTTTTTTPTTTTTTPTTTTTTPTTTTTTPTTTTTTPTTTTTTPTTTTTTPTTTTTTPTTTTTTPTTTTTTPTTTTTTPTTTTTTPTTTTTTPTTTTTTPTTTTTTPTTTTTTPTTTTTTPTTTTTTPTTTTTTPTTTTMTPTTTTTTPTTTTTTPTTTTTTPTTTTTTPTTTTTTPTTTTTTPTTTTTTPTTTTTTPTTTTTTPTTTTTTPTTTTTTPSTTTTTPTTTTTSPTTTTTATEATTVGFCDFICYLEDYFFRIYGIRLNLRRNFSG